MRWRKQSMPFVQGKCESCGGILTVDPSLKAANCPFCGSAYVVQDSINYYNTTIKVESMHADVVNVSDERTSEGRLKAAKAFMKLGKYANAAEEFKRVTELTPQNYLGWLGLIESTTNNYSKRIKYNTERKILEDYAKSVIVFAPDSKSEELLADYNKYIEIENKKNEQEITELNEELTKLNDERSQLKNQIDRKHVVLVEYDNTIKKINLKIPKIKTALAGTGAIFLFVAGGVLLGFGILFLLFSKGHSGYITSFIGSIPISVLIFEKIHCKKLEKTLQEVNFHQLDMISQVESLVKQIDTIDSSISDKQKEIAKY